MKELRLTYFSWIICITGVIVFSHNSNVANETRFRDLNYEAWEVITKETNQFSKVKDKDIIVSKTSNDAYEFNAGKFFHNTNKRITYIFRMDLLWPEVTTCKSPSDSICRAKNLPGTIERAKATIPNLNRDKNNWPRSTLNGDWVDKLEETDALRNSEVWVLDLFLLTDKLAVSFFAKTENRNKFPFINLDDSNLYTVSRQKDLEFRIRLNDYCLLPTTSETSKKPKGLWITKWENIDKKNQVLDYRDIEIGTC